MRRLVRKHLEQYGAVVEEASDGQPALELLDKALVHKQPFRLLLLDLMMPRVSGIQVLEAIRKHPDLQKLPVVVISARSDKETVLLCRKYEVMGYVLKPYKTHTLVATVLDVYTRAYGNKEEGEKQA